MKKTSKLLAFFILVGIVSAGCATEKTRVRSNKLLRDPLEGVEASSAVIVRVYPSGALVMHGRTYDQRTLAEALQDSEGGVRGTSIKQDHMVQLEAQEGVELAELSEIQRYLNRHGIGRVSIVTSRSFRFHGIESVEGGTIAK